MYKTIFLDWDGTISSSKFWWHLEKSKKREERIVFQKIEESLFGKFIDLLRPWMIGKFKSEDVIKKISQDTKLNFKYVFDEFVQSCLTMEFTLKDLPALVSELRKKGSKVIIATDNMDSFSRWTYPGLRLSEYFDGFLNSYEIGAMKS